MVKKALPDDAEDFSNLIMLSAPALFQVLYGDKSKIVIQQLFIQPYNLFSFEHVFFAEKEGNKAGMYIGWDWNSKKQEGLRTGLLLVKFMGTDFIKRLPLFIKVEDVIGQVYKEEYYISNIAVYPKYRRIGVGTYLLEKAEEEVKRRGTKKVILDVEIENSGALRLYNKLGYVISEESSVKLHKRLFRFYRMCKKLR